MKKLAARSERLSSGASSLELSLVRTFEERAQFSKVRICRTGIEAERRQKEIRNSQEQNVLAIRITLYSILVKILSFLIKIIIITILKLFTVYLSNIMNVVRFNIPN